MTDTPPSLRERISKAARAVRIRPGHNSAAIIRAGGTVALSGNEADDIAAAVMAVIQPELDRLRTDRDEFADRVDALTAVCKSNKAAHRSAVEECQRLQAELDAARDTTS